ncbi:MAG: serine hydrolase domain-containing protein [Pseudomonadota bacterium]
MIKAIKILYALMGVCFSLNAMAESTSITSLEGFIDGVMEQSVVGGETVGATVALVQNGRLLVARGYGLADRANNVPVQARLTTFRIGSITKVLTWMAVMQQVEAGKLDLDADIQSYMPELSLPDDFAEPITLRHLMTHTSGFEDDLSELFVGGPRQMRSLLATLQQDTPGRVRLPGTLTAYSNYGTALAGHAVANVADEDWHDYVEKYLTGPMRMTNTSTRQPLPDPLINQRSKGFAKTARGFAEQNFSYIPLAPAGSASATAQDMGRLMVELLNPNDTAILTARSKAALMGGAFVPSSYVNGMTLGMYEMSTGRTRAVGHDGSTTIFTARMILWPGQNLGLFVAVNSDSGASLVSRLSRTVAKRLGLDGRSSTYEPVSSGERYVGEYISARRNYSDYQRIFGLSDRLSVTYDRVPDLLRVEDLQGSYEFRQIASNVFEQVNGDDRIVFGRFGGAGNEVSGSGLAGTLYHSSRPMLGYERAVGFEQVNNNVLLLAFWVVVALSVVVGWPIATISRMGAGTSAGGALLTCIVFASVGLFGWFVFLIAATAESIVVFANSGIKRIPDLLWYSAGFCVLVLLQIGFLYRVWLGSLWWPLRRIHFTVMLVANCLLVYWLWYWRLLPEAVMSVF